MRSPDIHVLARQIRQLEPRTKRALLREVARRRDRIIGSSDSRSSRMPRDAKDVLGRNNRAYPQQESIPDASEHTPEQPTPVDPLDLARQIRYALPPREGTELVAEFDLEPRRSTPSGVLRRMRDRVSALTTLDPLRAVGLVVLVSAVVMGAVLGSPGAFNPLDRPTPPGGSTGSAAGSPGTAPPVTAIPMETEPEPEPKSSPDPGEDPIRRPDHEDSAIEIYCPDPPAKKDPGVLAPVVGQDAERRVLEPWQLQSSISIGGFDPTSETVRILPRARWVGTYRSPGGHHYRVAIDRWRTPPEARRAYLSLDGDGHAAIVWGAYVVRVDAFDDDGTLLPGAMGNDDARTLVSAVTVPGANRSLGNQCAFTLMGNPPS